MKLSSARDAKQALLATAGPLLAPPPEIAAKVMARGVSRTTKGRKRAARPPASSSFRSIESIRAEANQVPLFAVGVARKETGRKRAEYQLAVRLYARTQAAGQAALEELWRKNPALKRETHVVYGIRLRPRGLTLSAGTSCAHLRVGAGTLGGFVTDGQQVYILSCNHVLANCGICNVNDAIVQPSPNDSPNVRIVGRLTDWISLGQAKVDAAIAQIADSAEDARLCFYPTIGQTAKTIVTGLEEVTEVIKLGKTTDVTTGRVSGYEVDGVTMNYPGRSVTFNDQIEIVSNDSRPFSKNGDSGAVILDKESLRPYALLYGGGRGKDEQGKVVDVTFAHFLAEVFTELGVRLAA